MTTELITHGITVLIQNVTKLLNRHAVTLVQILSLLVIGLLISGFSLIADGPVYAAWMYFTTAMLAFVVIAFILFRSMR